MLEGLNLFLFVELIRFVVSIITFSIVFAILRFCVFHKCFDKLTLNEFPATNNLRNCVVDFVRINESFLEKIFFLRLFISSMIHLLGTLCYIYIKKEKKKRIHNSDELFP